ncbi:MAG: AMP-binding protein, partial [Thermodesulfobacteriota bacterium]|nr:AMP-binding protein [Thermodesulfobacteriota bacterium]
MNYSPIKKEKAGNMPVVPNLLDYKKAREAFTWEDIKRELDWFDDRRVNIVYEVLDRHLKTHLKDKVALYWEGKDNESEEYSFLDLSMLSNRFAGALKNLGVKKGDRIFTYMDRIPEQYICLLGALKTGGIIGPLFSAFGPDALKDRLGDCEARVLITTPMLVKTLHEIIYELPALETIIIVNRRNASYDLREKEVSYESIMNAS